MLDRLKILVCKKKKYKSIRGKYRLIFYIILEWGTLNHVTKGRNHKRKQWYRYAQYKHFKYPHAKKYHARKANFTLGEILQQKDKDERYLYKETLQINKEKTKHLNSKATHKRRNTKRAIKTHMKKRSASLLIHGDKDNYQ